jgi:hypothetical protein
VVLEREEKKGKGKGNTKQQRGWVRRRKEERREEKRRIVDPPPDPLVSKDHSSSNKATQDLPLSFLSFFSIP